ncbi:DNA polymerase III subunit delta' [Alcaligenaceae bacterium CGII-47]|nr:DNA polymerase III subunit delta' [Alcaligenaceae bacterium CGII-47]
MSAGGFLPWHLDLARSWLQTRDRFAHAWLIHGLRGVGQVAFAQAGAKSLLCESPRAGLACGTCQACHWVESGNHPDLRRIRPEALALQEGASGEAEGVQEEGARKKQASREIRVEQIRSLLPWFNTATHRAGWRVAVLYPAEQLNTISANALLKILEEPPEHTVFLVVADAPDRLLPTLVSRCRRLPLSVPTPEAAQHWLLQQGIDEPASWLAASGGAPLHALELARAGGEACPSWLDEFLRLCTTPAYSAGLADQLASLPTTEWLDGFQRLLVDLSLAARNAPIRYFPSRAQIMHAMASGLDHRQLSSALRWLTQQRRLASQPLNPKFLADHGLALLLRACRPVS